MRSLLLPLITLSAFAADFIAPAESVRTFKVTDADLAWELVLAEPDIAQPVFINWDERGRMWVCEYRQYPAPAGLTPVSHDDFWRTVYDKVPEPPPRGVKGADRISIHEDTDGDGRYDKHSVFVDGLNLCTAVEHGRGGHFVLQPPYLLFYADKNRDDKPDGPPDVLLSGFGIEDTHSIANSLRWGPDGWLYGAHGSTVTSRLKRPGDKQHVVEMIGQGIWRYHPETRRAEVFAEGGGNTFGVEFDAQGRLFSGHNGGDTRGFHYVQGGWLRKGFEKHGQLSNPYAFGYFDAMKSDKTERFTHNFIIYEGGALGAKYEGKVFGIEPLQGRVVLSERYAEGSTFGTRDLGRIVTSTDKWFRPVDIKAGPDGAIYVADFHEPEIGHIKHREGPVAKETGRVWRLRRVDAGKVDVVLVAKAEANAAVPLPHLRLQALKRLLNSKNKWVRQTTLRLVIEHHGFEAEAEAPFNDWTEQYALENTWADTSRGVGGSWLGKSSAVAGTKLPTPAMREWEVRLLCDHVQARTREGQPEYAPPAFKTPGKDEILERANWFQPKTELFPEDVVSLSTLAREDTDIYVRAQLAASARRLPAAQCLAIVRELMLRDEDAADPRQPLMLWWAIESKCANDRDAVLKLFEDSTLWERPLVRDHILERLMRRFTQSGTRAELLACARLLDLAPGAEHAKKLMSGFEAATRGRTLAGLPEELARAIAKRGGASLALRLRLGENDARAEAVKLLGDPKADAPSVASVLSVLSEIKISEARDTLLALIERGGNDTLRDAALSALQLHDDPAIADRIIAWLAPKPNGKEGARHVAVLATRPAWSLALARAVADGRLAADEVPPATVRRIKLHKAPALIALAEKLWPGTGSPTTAEMEKTIARLTTVVSASGGDPYKGETLYQTSCASCHKLHGSGGAIGPDLTSYQRDDTAAMLTAIVNPSGEIREGYENLTLTTRDGRTLAGFLAEQDEKIIVLRGLDGTTTTLARSDIASQQASGASLMPPGLLTTLNDEQVRDLFAYLRSTQPLPPRRK